MSETCDDPKKLNMIYCQCEIPKKWHGDNYCLKCSGLIESKLRQQKDLAKRKS